MWAIEITENNLEEIMSSHSVPEKTYAGLQLFIKSPSTWYICSGYVNDRGAVQGYAILPDFKFQKKFEYDHEKIQTEWVWVVQP